MYSLCYTTFLGFRSDKLPVDFTGVFHQKPATNSMQAIDKQFLNTGVC